VKQVLRKGLSEIVVRDVPDPVLSPHHVIVRPAYSLISSGTETASIHREGVMKAVVDNPSHLRRIWHASRANGPVRTLSEVMAKFSEYAVLGYAGAGVIVGKHESVRDLEIGASVAYGGEGTGHGELIMCGRNLAVRVPEAVGLDQACFATLGSIALNAVRTAQIGLGETVAVIGLGLVGQLVAQLARLQGAVVIGLDLRPERLALASRLGCHHVLEAGGGAAEAVAAITDGRGADHVVVAAAAKSPGPALQALAIARDRGQIVVVGAVELSFPWEQMYRKEIRLLMSRAYGPGSYDPAYEKGAQDYPIGYVRWTENRNMEHFLRLLDKGEVDVQPLITDRFALERAPQAYERIMDPASGTLAVLLRYPSADAAALAPYVPVRKVHVRAPEARAAEMRVAVTGAGNIARWIHVPNLMKIPGVRLHAVHSASGARGRNYAERFGAAYCTSDYGELLEDDDVEAIVILSRNPEHAAQAISALEAGKHVFVEKPMALTEKECRAIWAAVESSGRQLTVGFNRRFAPAYREMKRQLRRRQGAAVVNCRMSSPSISGSYWMADPSIGGAILGEACHFVDLMYWLLESELVAVSAFSLPLGSNEPIGENNLAASFRFADGSIANLTYCTVGRHAAGGERLEAFAEGIRLAVEDFGSPSWSEWPLFRPLRLFPAKGHAEQMHDFFVALRESRLPQVTVADGARATLACLKMLESARTGQPCTIDVDTLRP